MVDDIEADVEAHKPELIKSAATLFAVQRVHGEDVRNQTMQAYRQLLDAHLLIMGVLAAALLRISGKITAFTQTSDERNALFASFVIGWEICERAMVEGRYLQACALLRQEMETLAQLKAVSDGKRKETSSPNVKTLGESLSRLYGELSAAAHVSKHHIVRTSTEYDAHGANFPEQTCVTRYFPVFDEGLARRSFGLHLLLIMHVIEEMSIDLAEQQNADGFTEREGDAINLALQIMRDEKMIE
jgi:hypothetical protein